MKKIITLLLTAAITTASLTACTGDSENSESKPDSSVAVSAEESKDESTEQSVAVLDVDALTEAIKKLTKATDTTVRSADDVYNDIGIDPASYEEGFWLIDATITVETVAVYKAKDADGAEAIKKLMDNYVKSVVNQQENYNVENYNMASTAKVAVSGSYAYMVMSPNVDAIAGAIDAAIKG